MTIDDKMKEIQRVASLAEMQTHLRCYGTKTRGFWFEMFMANDVACVYGPGAQRTMEEAVDSLYNQVAGIEKGEQGTTPTPRQQNKTPKEVMYQ